MKDEDARKGTSKANQRESGDLKSARKRRGRGLVHADELISEYAHEASGMVGNWLRASK